MTDISELVDRLTKATGGDREIDKALERLAFGDDVIPFTADYTSSIDSALALCERLLPGWTVQIFQLRRNKGWGGRVSSPRYDTFSSFEDDAHATEDGFVGQANGAIATLKALDQGERK